MGWPPVDIEIVHTHFVNIVPAGTTTTESGTTHTVDGGGRLALPGFLNTHAHVEVQV